jgi:hypothetical protein
VDDDALQPREEVPAQQRDLVCAKLGGDRSHSRFPLGHGGRLDRLRLVQHATQLGACCAGEGVVSVALFQLSGGGQRLDDIAQLIDSLTEDKLEEFRRGEIWPSTYDWPMNEVSVRLPGHELVSAGLADLAAGRESEASLIVAMAAPRLRALGFEVRADTVEQPAYRLYQLLETGDGGAHSRYNALVGRIVSFARAAEHASAG